MFKPRLGETAGKIWKALGCNEELTLQQLRKEVPGDPMACGWLAREDKIRFVQKGKTVRIGLTEAEKAHCKEQDESRKC